MPWPLHGQRKDSISTYKVHRNSRSSQRTNPCDKPLFNKPTAKLPPCIEKWVMSMQDADYEVTYEPRKNERDPLDFMSRHPLSETGDYTTEKWIKTVIHKEHPLILDKVRAEVKKDQMFKTLTEAIMNEKWKNLNNNPSLTPYNIIVL